MEAKKPDEDVLVLGIVCENEFSGSRIYKNTKPSLLLKKLQNEMKVDFDFIFIISKDFNVDIYPEW